MSVSAEYNDNNRLSAVPGSEIEVSGAKVYAQVTIQAETPTSSFELTPGLRATFYPGDPNEEADDQFARMTVAHDTARTHSDMRLDYSRVTTIGYYFPSSEIGGDDVLGNPDPGVDVGRFPVKNRQERVQLIPTARIVLSERSALDLRATYLDVAYDRQVPGDRQDFTSIGGQAGFRFRTSPTASLALRGGYSRFDPKTGDKKDTYGVDAEWENDLSETAQIYVRGGVDRTEVDVMDGGSGTKWEEGFTGGAGIRWQFEVTKIFIDANHYLDPNASGQIVTRDQLRTQWSRRLGPMTTIFVGARAIKDSGVGDQEFNGRTYAAGNIGFEWRLARAWSLLGSYQYRWRDIGGALPDAESNLLTLGIVYEPKRGER